MTASQIRALMSADAVTTHLPSGAEGGGGYRPLMTRQRENLAPVCSCGVPIRAVLSVDAVTTRLPSGLKAAETTGP